MKKLFFILLLCPLFILPAYAQSPYEVASEEIGTAVMDQALTADERSITGQMVIDGNYDTGGAVKRLGEYLKDRLVTELKSNLRLTLQLLAMLAVYALLCTAADSPRTGQFTEICCTCAMAALLVGSVDSLITQVMDAIYRLSDYARVSLPVVFTAAAASGAVTSAGTQYAVSCMAINVLMDLVQELLLPCICAYLALTLSNSLFPHTVLQTVAKGLKWAATTLMTCVTIAFTSYLHLTGLIGGSVDAAAVKAARTVISGALPVVGGMISDASAAVLSAAGVVRSCSGAFGLVAVCAICAGPFAVLSVRTFLLKTVSELSGAMHSPRIQCLLSGVGSTLAMLMGLLGSCAIMLFMALTSGMKAVSG